MKRINNDPGGGRAAAEHTPVPCARYDRRGGDFGAAAIAQLVGLRQPRMKEFLDYYENQHSSSRRTGAKPALPNALRYVRRYLTPVRDDTGASPPQYWPQEVK